MLAAAHLLICLGLSGAANPPASAVLLEDVPPLQPVPIRVEDGKGEIDLSGGEGGQSYLLIFGSAAMQPPAFAVNVRQRLAEGPARPAKVQRSVVDPFWKDHVRSRRWQMQVRRSLKRETPETYETARFAPVKGFHLFVGEDDFHDVGAYRKVTAKLTATGKHCLVYVDEEDLESGFSIDTADYVAETFDREIYPVTSSVFGRHRDVDRNGRFTILFTHWLGNLSGGKVALGGFVRGGDFYRDIEAPFSNNCDMMYLNSRLAPGDHLRTLLAHEYVHAITFSEHVFGRYLVDGVQTDEQSWLSEAISHLAENIAGSGWSNLDYRVSTYLTAPSRYRLVVPDYFRAGLWRCHGSRGSTYLFLRWCVDRYGEEFLGEITQSNLSGVENIETAAQTPFRDLFRQWCVDMCLAGLRDSEPSASVDLHGRLERRLLAGVQPEHLDRDGSLEFRLAPTGMHAIRADVDEGDVMRIELQTSADHPMQLTAVRLPEKSPTATLAVVPSASLSQAVEIRMTHMRGVPVKWEAASWEQTSLTHVPKDSDYKSAPIHRWETLFDASVSQKGDELTSRPIRVSGNPSDLTFKAVGKDAEGRPVAAWGRIEAEPTVRWASQ